MVGRIGRMMAGVGLVVMLGAVGAGCESGFVGPKVVGMRYRPTDSMDLGASSGIMKKSAVVEVVDGRQQKDRVGVNRESKDKEIAVVPAEGQTPADLVRQAMERCLKGAGVEVRQAGEQADRKIVVDLTRFWVEETSTYQGSVAANVRVLPGDAAGENAKALWEGQASGANERFGLSLKEENYQETLSDATLQMCSRVLREEGFRKAME